MLSLPSFNERREDFRLPYAEKVLCTDITRSMTAHAVNISRGGLFVKTLDPFPIDTEAFLAFVLPQQENAMVVRAKVSHLVVDRQRCELECGMGFQFLDLTKVQSSVLNLHMLNEQAAYTELKELLKCERPNVTIISRLLESLPSLVERDLLGLRYRVNRTCALFENSNLKNTL